MIASDFQGRLLPRERLLWAGAPEGGLLFTGYDVFLIPFSVVWCWMAVTFPLQTINREVPLIFLVVPILFVAVGLFFVFGRFLFDMWLRAHTSYAVTDRRILVLRKAPFSTFTAVALERLPELRLVGERGDIGTVRFGGAAPSWLAYWSFGFFLPTLDPVPQFLKIRNARKVFDLVSQASERRAWELGQDA